MMWDDIWYWLYDIGKWKSLLAIGSLKCKDITLLLTQTDSKYVERNLQNILYNFVVNDDENYDKKKFEKHWVIVSKFML
jgi:hypothetical protein